MLKVEGLSVDYGNIRVIKNISLNIKEGELVSIIGANGAGKTTLLRAISGFIPYKSGNIEFLGENLKSKKYFDIVKMGISHCLERRRLFPYMTVLENLELGAFTRNKKKEIYEDIENVFSHFPALKERKKQLAGTLSGGEQQMVSIGRALMAKPKVFLIDEPSLGLAPILVEKLFSIINEIHISGKTIVLVEQNAYSALEISNRAYVMETGNIVLEGEGKSLLNNEHVKKAYLGG